jgi:hypothetical protein
MRRDCMKVELLHRLHWDVFEFPEVIEVEDGSNEDGTPRLHPFLSHAIAAEPIANSPITHLLLYAMDVDGYS